MSTAVRAEPASRPIVGMGAVAATGAGVDELFESLCTGRAQRPEWRGAERSSCSAPRAGQAHDRPVPGTDVPGRAARLLLDAVGQAAADAGLGEDLSGIPVLVGTGMRDLRPLELWWRDGSPFADSGLGFGSALRERFNVEVTHTFSHACSASLYALALASDLLGQEGEDALDTVIVAGVDVLAERPLPSGGDSAAAIVLRRADCRSKRVIGHLRGVAVTHGGPGYTAPSPDGIADVMRSAHQLAGVKASDVDLVMLHGGGALGDDEAEAAALAAVLGEASSGPLMTAVRSMNGQHSGVSGLLSLIVGIRALNQGRVPPSAAPGVRADEAASSPFRFVTGRPADGQRLSVAQLNAFGLGGINAVAIVEGTEHP
ncbi:beta-ketoacyl synthase N-terminal-like domain-containing protein [Streptomyces poonensis]|uniref:Ketosynthase family 3 (KS3) domain-containing protein n=1 Tax=Streptomyces poonensis TaxID=68255 RepID=A0A918PXR7_9ACTN|nr:beta-ketoacyl synthase N-terminal-like domain-containing protein [Streptomyces poonensis]GGZ25682.1 hypothetical protein GCM10010365_52420 [Streptomyces poonensis]GLJ89095.1 hypothetical protein GCM10017589_16950 [Streptomyces poonensis]